MHRSRLPGAIRATLLAAALGLGLATATHAAPPAKAAAKANVIVAFKAGSKAAAQAAINGVGGRVVGDLSEANALAAEVPSSALAALRRNPNVEFVENDPIRRPLGFATPKAKRRISSGPGTAEQEPYGIEMVQADQVSDESAGIRKVCIIDSGVDGSHEDLQGVPMDGVNLTQSGSWNTDENSHGTHVAGTIAAVDNAVGVVGVLPKQTINLFIAKVFEATGGARSSTVARAMLKCMLARSHVVSMSLGSDGASRVEQRVADILEKRGILMIAAAGNDGNDVVNYPAGFANVVSVGAVDSKKVFASFSQFNADVELAAPGVDVLSTVPLGSETAATVNAGGTPFPAIPMEGSPRTSATGPLADFGFGQPAAAGSMAGNVCLISRGEISFAEKVLNCQNAGGVGAIVFNNVPDEPVNGTLGETVTTIPSVGTTQADGQTMKDTKLGQSTTVAVFGTNDVYALKSGTSMATPHVSGVAALVWSHFPHCTAAEIRSSLNKNAQDLGDAGRDVHYGWGLVQAKATYDAILNGGCGN
jgi:subtilisin family serine protease